MGNRVKQHIFGDKRVLILPGNLRSCIKHAAEQFITLANEAVDKHGFFSVALAGGSTPLPIYQELTSKAHENKIPWDKILLFWSDERNVSPDHADSNYRMAMDDGGFNAVGLKKENIFRMVAEENLETNSLIYEETIKVTLKNKPIDLVLLGLGTDGHTASLFPHTEALHVNKRLVVPNYVPSLNTHRMTMTFDLINRSPHIHVYVFGKSKDEILDNVLLSDYKPDEFPIQRIGTPKNKALFFVDDDASFRILSHIQ